MPSELRIETFDEWARLIATCGSWLAANEAEHNVLLGERTARPGELFLRVVEESETRLVASLSRGWLQLSRAASSEGTLALATALGPRAEEISVVAGPADTTAAFVEGWRRVTSRQLRLQMQQRIYALTSLRQPRAVSGRLRAAAPDDQALLEGWIVSFAEEARLPATDRDAMRSSIAVRAAAGTLFVWDDEGIVSMAAIVRTTPAGGGVSLVYTPPPLRARGYASACVASVSARILASGKQFCFLYTDRANPTSNGIYVALGYEAVADAAVWIRSDGPRPVP